MKDDDILMNELERLTSRFTLTNVVDGLQLLCLSRAENHFKNTARQIGIRYQNAANWLCVACEKVRQLNL